MRVDLSTGDPTGQGRTRLHDERISTQVIRVHRERGLEAPTPVDQGLTGSPVDEVETHLLEPGGTRPAHDLRQPVGIERWARVGAGVHATRLTEASRGGQHT